MATSANVMTYRILKGNHIVGEHRQHGYCKTSWDKLYKFAPIDEHEIQELWQDEDEVGHAGGFIPLDKFLLRQANSGCITLINDGEYFFWENDVNQKRSQNFAWEHEAVMAYHTGFLQWSAS